MSLLSQWQSILPQIHCGRGRLFMIFYTKILKPFCPLKPWTMIQIHHIIIHRVVFVSCNQKIIFICKLLSSVSYQDKVQIISGQNLATPVTVIWWNRNPSWKKRVSNEVWPAKDTGHFRQTRLNTMGSKNIWSWIHISIHQPLWPFLSELMWESLMAI